MCFHSLLHLGYVEDFDSDVQDSGSCSFVCTVYYGGYGKWGIVGILKVLNAPGVIKQSFIEVFVDCMIRWLSIVPLLIKKEEKKKWLSILPYAF